MSFSHDRRGQSVVVGTVVLFGFLILALSLYQVQVVPQQNAQTEFEHFGEVRDDLVDLSSGIERAGLTGTRQVETVRLGTTYSPRLFSINPPAPAGTLRTSASYPITVSNETDSQNITTRFVQYRPGYNEIDASPTWYETSVLYLDARGNGNRVAVIEEQSLVADDGTVQITAVQNEFSRSGTGRISLEMYPTREDSEPFPTGNLTVKIPTRLTGEEYWDNSGISTTVYNGVSENQYEEGIHELTLSMESEDLTVNTVGIDRTPSEGAKRTEDPSGGSNVDDNDDSDDSGDSGDSDPEASDVEMRVDDLTRLQSDNPEFYVSYDVSVDFDEIQISAEDSQNEFGASDQTTSTDARNGVRLGPGFDSGEEFAVTVTAIEGGEAVAERTILTDADTQNPSENDDLALADSAVLDSSTITDRTQVQQDSVRYRFSYDVSPTGSYLETQMYVLNENGEGASGSTTRTARSANNVDVNVGNGADNPYKLAILVLDADGVVVDDRIENDTANGSGTI